MSGRRLRTSVSAVLIALVSACGIARASERVLEQEFPAEGIETLRLVAGNGSARVTAGDDDRIHVTVRVTPKRWTDDEPWRKALQWFLTSEYEDVNDLIAAVRIDSGRTFGGALKVSLLPSGRTRESRVAEEWTVTLPARMALDMRMDATEAEITGITGGVTIDAGVGGIVVDVPRGGLDVSIKVGKLTLTDHSAEIGDIRLGSKVGKVSLRLDDRYFEVPSEPGPGTHVSVKGHGRDSILAWIEVGDISARLGKTE